MFVVIFGRPGCPYCVRAKNLAEKLKGEVADFDYRYVDIIAEGIANAGNTVSGTANAADLKDIANIAKAFDLKGVPIQQRRLLVNPTHKYRYLTTENLSKVAYAGNSDALRSAELGSIYGLDTYMSQNAPDTLAATAGTATAAKVSCTAGATKVALSDVTAATGTFKKGDGFILDGYLYRFAAGSKCGRTVKAFFVYTVRNVLQKRIF